ncbi:MAG: glycosyltransferase family 2 protein [Pseudomonadota bacterium]
MDVLISIINYATPEMTKAAVKSALAELSGLDGKVVVVDNASPDGSSADLADWAEALDDPRLAVRLSPINTGFSGGHNLAMGTEDADYALILNSDAILRPGALGTLLRTAKAEPDAALISPLLQYEDGRVQVSTFIAFRPINEFVRAAETGVISRMMPFADQNRLPPPEGPDIGWVSFACVLLNMRAAKVLGPMDEGFFLYFEDADYCMQAQTKGWRVIKTKDAVVVHHRGGSAPVKGLIKRRERLPAYFYASRTRLFRKHFGPLGPFAANLLFLAGYVIARLRAPFGGQPLSSPKREWLDIWTNFWDPLGDSRGPRRDG